VIDNVAPTQHVWCSFTKVMLPGRNELVREDNA
jgi:hypothetical protein